ncbi:MAG: MBL fold metallo-hydrolase [Myxococcales bacterium]|nr:MBL fold metallo-hydrolase [Myxococcales bacterium]MCB9731203.1 MBL fold metallo-hydrolase [Deltaproteobacteria bacterium]
MQRFRIGDVEVVAVLEDDGRMDPAFIQRHVIPAATREALAELAWLDPGWLTADGEPRMVTQAMLVRSEGVTILVDTCIGNDKPRLNPRFDRLQTDFLGELARAGVAPGDVDVVLCTHLHFDHVGWNTRWDGAAWVPTFPRARYLIHRREWEHWRASGRIDYLLADSVQPVVDAGLVDLVEGDHAVTAEVRLVPTPGHTPGHVSVAIASRGERAVITGDMLHHPCQVGRPEWTGPADSDQQAARATREAFLDEAREDDVLVIGTHFPSPAAGRVRGDDAAPGRRRLIRLS